MDEDLKPCPFCGSEELRYVTTFETKAVTRDEEHAEVYVKCGVCCGQGPKGNDLIFAIRQWNRRADG